MPGKPLKANDILLFVPYALALIISAMFLRGHSLWLSALLPVLLGLLYWIILRRIRLGSLSALLGLSLLLRLLVIWGLPNLSDDFYRFLWDGWLWLEGINPFTHSPEQFADSLSTGYWQELWLKKMNSPAYHTVYPPLHQVVFIVGGWFGELGGTLAGVQAMRVVLVFGEMLLIYRLWVLYNSQRLKVRPEFYALNPLVILEISGNLHFEGLMVLFLLMSLSSRISLAKGGWLAAAVGVKLLPLILLPAFLFRHGLKDVARVLIGFSMISIVIWLPFIPWDAGVGIGESLALYFETFEFNSSVFKLVNSIASQWVGYNVISYTGPVMALITFVFIMLISYRKTESVAMKASMAWWVFLLLSTTVHPWYAIPLLLFGYFYLKKSAMYWSVAILWSYLFYLLPNSFWIVQVVEYTGLAIILAFELRSLHAISDDDREFRS